MRIKCLITKSVGWRMDHYSYLIPDMEDNAHAELIAYLNLHEPNSAPLHRNVSAAQRSRRSSCVRENISAISNILSYDHTCWCCSFLPYRLNQPKGRLLRVIIHNKDIPMRGQDCLYANRSRCSLGCCQPGTFVKLCQRRNQCSLQSLLPGRIQKPL